MLYRFAPPPRSEVVDSSYTYRVPPGEEDSGLLRIGELSRRVGVTPEVLRAWERRYGLFSPARTSGGFRLYDQADERRILRMLDQLARGVSAAEAARLAREEPPGRSAHSDEAREYRNGTPSAAALGVQLGRTLDEYDDLGAHAVLDRLLGSYPLPSVLREAVLPYLHDLGERWEHGQATIAQEHFASALLRGRLLALARGWGQGRSSHSLLASVPGDQHEFGLICFGLALSAHGWRITYLGPDTPLVTLKQTAELLRPALVVVSATLPEQADGAREGLREVASVVPLRLGGDGASATIAETVGARFLEQDPVTAAEVTALEIGPRG